MTAKRKSGSTDSCDWVRLPRSILTLSMPAAALCCFARLKKMWLPADTGTGAPHRRCTSGVDLAGGDEEKAQMPETTIMLLILSWKMGAAKFGEVSKEVCAVRARNESAPPQTQRSRAAPQLVLQFCPLMLLTLFSLQNIHIHPEYIYNAGLQKGVRRDGLSFFGASSAEPGFLDCQLDQSHPWSRSPLSPHPCYCFSFWLLFFPERV
jgi:hypothetical protein